MHLTRRSFIASAAVAASGLGLRAGPASAQPAYPARPITLICPGPRAAQPTRSRAWSPRSSRKTSASLSTSSTAPAVAVSSDIPPSRGAPDGYSSA